jgi:CheY-like chemotaxis protein
MQKNKALIVDDEAAQRWMLREALTEWGYETVEAADSAQALTVAVAEQPDIILLDINLPDGSGLELLRKLKIRLPHAAILMVTGEAVYDNVVAALRGGALDFLRKPLALAELQQALQRIKQSIGQTVSPLSQPAKKTSACPPRILILCDTPERIPPLQAVFSTQHVSLTSILFPEEWDYVINEQYDLALLSVAPELLEAALKNLRACDPQARLTILVEMVDAAVPPKLAGVLPQYRAMQYSRDEMIRLAKKHFATSSRPNAAALML